MDRQAFIDATFDFDVVDDSAQERAISKAERGVGMTLDALAEGSSEQDWMENIAQRHYLNWIIKTHLRSHNYGSAAIQQKFANAMAYLEILKAEWAGMKTEMMAKRTTSAFEVVRPGFSYDIVGRPTS